MISSSKDQNLPLPTPEYRANIDGLRAVAVGGVMAFHAFPEWLQGGFIGVDVFFVISGYLITSLILKTIENRTFSFSDFYARRIRRIFPSLILVTITCCCFGWFALLPDEYRSLGKHVVGSAVFIPNFLFWSESGYFDYAADTKPLLHLWSLGIEAQFYLLWPLMVWLSLKCRSNLIITSGVLLFASLVLNVSIVDSDTAGAFFSPLTRFWELVSGALLACFLCDENSPFAIFRSRIRSGPIVDNGLAIFGMMCLLLGASLLTPDVLYPGAWALIPVAGTLFIIMAGDKAWLNRAVLSNRLLVGIGLISFPLYLWHWPLLSFARILEGSSPDFSIRVAAVVLSFVLASLTYYFIEKPVRFGLHKAGKTFLLVILMALSGSLGLFIFIEDGFKFRASSRVIAAQVADLNFDLPDSEGWYCQDASYDSPRCHSTGPSPSVVVIGDSHAMTIYAGLRDRFKAKGQDIGLYGASDGCPPLLNVVIQDQGGDPRNCLKKGTQAIQRIIADPTVHEVIVTSRGPMYTTATGFGDIELDQFGTWVLHFEGERPGARTNEEVFFMGMTKTLDALLSAGKKVTYMYDVPELGFDIRSCVSFRPFAITSKVYDPCAVSKDIFESRNKTFRSMMQAVLSARPSIHVIDLATALCDEARCLGARDGVLFYIDDDHLSNRGSAYVVRQLWDDF
jgi:peptidoglycan/LPS O-acetylase OafA/YrhL